MVHEPDSLFPACQFEANGLYLGAAYAVVGLPNNPNYRIGPQAGEIAQAGPDTTVCPGDSVQLGLPPVREGLVFEWTPPHGLSCADCPQPWASPVADAKYKLTVRDTLSDLGPDCSLTWDYVWVKVPHEDLGAGFSYSPDTFAEAPYTVALVSQTPEYDNVWIVGSDTVYVQMIDYEFPDTGRYAVKLIVRDTLGCAVDWTADTLHIVRDTVTGRASVNPPSFEVYPNPARETLTLRAERIPAGCAVEVRDPLGRVRLSEPWPPGRKEVSVPLDGWPAGVYAVRWTVLGRTVGTAKVAVAR